MTQPAPAIHTETINFRAGAEVPFRMLLIEGGIFEMGGTDKEALSIEKPLHKYW